MTGKLLPGQPKPVWFDSTGKLQRASVAVPVRKTFVCPDCGSKNMLFDATARWNETSQEYELSTVFTGSGSEDASPICIDCGEENIPLEREIT